jgi:hypothetical protein
MKQAELQIKQQEVQGKQQKDMAEVQIQTSRATTERPYGCRNDGR